MVLTNAERQARHRQRQKERAARAGVTPADVREVARIIFDAANEGDDHAPAWDEWLASTQTKKGRGEWMQLLPHEPPELIEDDAYGDRTDLVRRVAAVVWAIRNPPAVEADRTAD